MIGHVTLPFFTHNMRFHINIFSVIKELNIVRKQKTYCHSAQFSIANI